MTDVNKLLMLREIEDLILEYAIALDRKDYDLLDNIFTPDAHVEYLGIGDCHGCDAVKGLVTGVLEQCAETQHMLSNIRIKLNGDTATASCYLQAIHVGKGDHEGQLLTIWGEYLDELILTDSGWRISKRQLRTIFSQGDVGLH